MADFTRDPVPVDDDQSQVVLAAIRDYLDTVETKLADFVTKLTDGSARVGGTVATSGPLTDTQLRASRVPVDGSGVTQPVSGPLTDAQLRAAAVSVDTGAATGTAIASNSAVAAGATKLWGVTLRETAGSSCVVRLRDGVVGGTILATISLNAGESVRELFAKPVPVANAAGVYVQLVSGTIPEGTVFTS